MPIALPTRLPLVLLLVLLPLAAAGDARADIDAAMRALRTPGAVALMRHAYAPGTGDPDDLTLGDCTTQRNLDDRGRAQARALGERFRAHGIAAARVYSSQWCRCRETARLLGFGEATDLPAANSFHRWPERRARQTAELEAFLAGLPPGEPAIVVSHQVNISALTGSAVRSGETVVVRPTRSGDVEVIGRFMPPDPEG